MQSFCGLKCLPGELCLPVVLLQAVGFQLHTVTKCHVNIPGAARLTMFRSHFVMDVQGLTVSTPVSHAGGFIDQSRALEPPNALPGP